MKNLHGYWNKKLLAFTSINDDRNSSQLRVVLSLLSVCHTPLQIDDMCNILNIDVLQAEKIYDAMIDVFHIDSISNGHLSLPISLCDYIKGHPLYLNTCKESNKQIIEWIIGFINNTQIEVQNIPLYVLQHAAEYIANRESLRDLLARREWWNELEQRVQSPFITREVILRAWDAILQKYTQSDESTCISNIVACSIMLTTLNIMILPEWIQELAARNLWTIDQVSEYALHYFIINDGIMIIKNIVDSPKQPIKQWINPDNLIDPYIRSFMLQALEDLDLLDTLMLSPQQRSEAIYQWVQHWGIFDGSTRAREQERLKTLLSALQQTIPESEGHDPADGPRLNQLLTELQNYESPVNSIEFDPRLPNLLLEICTAWQHRRTWQSLQILSAILRPLTRYSRADLLYALELLSPALRQRLGPQAFTELSQTIEFAATHYR
jgi:hypothetical protein